MGRYRDAWDQLKKFRHICSADLKKEAKRKADLEVEEKRLVELEEFRSKAKAEANLKAKIAEAEGKLMCTKCQAEMMPNAEGVYEFESWQGGAAAARPAQGQQAAPQTSAVESSDMMMQEDEGVDLMSFDMDPDEEDKIKRTLVEKTKYKEVAPTWELNIEVRMMIKIMMMMMMMMMMMVMMMIVLLICPIATVHGALTL